MRIFSYLSLVVILLVGLTFASLNSQSVVINYYAGSSQLALSLLLAITLFMGVLFGLIVAGFTCIRLKIENRRLQQRAKLAEKEVANLRAIPLKDSH